MKEQVYSLQSAADSSVAEGPALFAALTFTVAGAIAAFALLEVLIFEAGLDFGIAKHCLEVNIPG